MFEVYTYSDNLIKYYARFDTEKECDDFARERNWDIYWINKF